MEFVELYITGSCILVGGFFLALTFKRPKLEENKKNFFRRHKRLVQFMAISFILIGIYDFIYKDYRCVDEMNGWTSETTQRAIQNTMRSTGRLFDFYPDIAYQYSVCVISKLQDSLTYKEYVISQRMPPDSAMKKYSHLICDCLKNLEDTLKQIDSLGDQTQFTFKEKMQEAAKIKPTNTVPNITPIKPFN